MMKPVPYFGKMFGNPALLSSVRAFRGYHLGRRKHYRVIQNFIRKIKGLPPKNPVWVKGDFYIFIKPHVSFYLGGKEFTITCLSNKSMQKVKQELIEWGNNAGN